MNIHLLWEYQFSALKMLLFLQRVGVAKRMTLLGPLGPEMSHFSGRRKGGYPRPGYTFRRPGSNFRRQDHSQHRPPKRKNNEGRRQQSSNKKIIEDSQGTSLVQQEAKPLVDVEATRAVDSDEWGVPDLSDSLFSHCKSLNFNE